jgi:uncharacterized glyoxalase superfamily protein PhnB
MLRRVVPMIHVPDVGAAVAWYQAIGFTLGASADDGEDTTWALMSLGGSELMFSAGGQASAQPRREVDLYVHTDNVDDVYRQLKERVEVVEAVHDTFYGMREFIIRDLNRFWITFGQEIPAARPGVN